MSNKKNKIKKAQLGLLCMYGPISQDIYKLYSHNNYSGTIPDPPAYNA